MERKLTQMLEHPSQTLKQSFRGGSQNGGNDLQDEPQVSVYQACYALAQAEVEKLTEDVYKSKHPEAKNAISIAEDDAIVFR